MADYYPLIARALEGLQAPSRAEREQVYERARTALRSQLGSVRPPLDADAVETELASLEEAIGKAERGIGPGPSGRAPDPTSAGLRPDDRTPPIKRGGRRTRPLLVGGLLVLVIAPIAGLAWLWRDKPDTVATAPAPRRRRRRPRLPEANRRTLSASAEAVDRRHRRDRRVRRPASRPRSRRERAERRPVPARRHPGSPTSPWLRPPG